MAATNRPDVLDSALLRPGRFDRKITLDLPQRRARQQILAVHCREVPLAPEVDLEELAAGTVGFSGADLKNLVNEAALRAARHEQSLVRRSDFEEARDRIVLGSQREELLTSAEQRLVACHEAGHALVAWHLPGTDPVKRITIIPRGRSLGATEQRPVEDRHSVTRRYLENRLAVMLAAGWPRTWSSARRPRRPRTTWSRRRARSTLAPEAGDQQPGAESEPEQDQGSVQGALYPPWSGCEWHLTRGFPQCWPAVPGHLAPP